MHLTAEQKEIQALARDFARNEIRPHAAAWDAEAALDDGVFASLAELGFLGLLVPEGYGGLDLDPLTFLVILEELAWGDAAVALSVAIHNGPVTRVLARHGSDAQKERWLPAMAAGETLGAFALSEEEAGSDAAALACRAEDTPDGWRLTGTKSWVTNGERAGLVLVFARTGEGRHDIGCFLVDPGAEGYAVTGRTTTMGLRASETADVTLSSVSAELVGRPDRGFGYAMEAVDVGRLAVAAQAVGIARAAMEHALGYAVEREQFGTAIADFGAVQEKLARMAGRIAGARAQTHRAAALVDADAAPTGLEGLTTQAALAKVAASEAAMWVADEAVQIYGGYGYMRDYPVEKLMRDAKGTEIYEGSNEVLRHRAAREILREVRGGAAAPAGAG